MSACVCVCCVVWGNGIHTPVCDPIPPCYYVCHVCITQSQLSCLPALTLKPSDSVHFDHVCVVTLYVCVTQSYSYPVCPNP